MSDTPADFLSRREVAAGLLALTATPVLAAAPRVVTLLGDSITAGFGLPSAQALPAQLQAELNRLHANAKVRGAGVSGDTSADGLRRVDFSVKADTAVCVVALGGNDLLRGLEPAVLKSNLKKIVRKLQARNITVVLAGIRAPQVLAGPSAGEFNDAQADVGRMKGVVYLPDLLQGVAGKRDLNQRDGIHPNAAGARLIAARLAPVVVKALAVRR